jgi:hypothetical protein
VKITIMIFALLLGVQVKASTLNCSTEQKIEGWDGSTTHDYLKLTAEVTPSGDLQGAVIGGAYLTDQRDLTADANYKPTSPTYKMFNRFSVLEDAWNWFSILLPKDLSQRGLGQKFSAYVQIVDEEGFKGTEKLTCALSN